MDPVQFLEQFGIPLSVACAFGYFIWKQNQFIQKELMEELDEGYSTIDDIKDSSPDALTKIEGIEDIMQRLTGGKLKIKKEDE
jgi:DNA integrity scanning protein DisA with diadenylate cyclase activity